MLLMRNLKYTSFLKPAIIIVCLGLGIFVVFAAASAKENKDVTVDRFISPEVCSDCHGEIYEQWQNSMHHLAHKDPVYARLAKFLRKGLTDAGEIAEAESCVKCHTPVGYISGFPKKVSDDLSRTPGIATAGIQCDYCHSAESVKQIHNNGLVIRPGHGEDDPGVKFGPFDDSEPDFHEAQYSKLHTEARFCGTCHNVKHVAFGTDLETTYTEWKNSVYANPSSGKAVSCQGCHMYQRPGIPATGSTPRPENPGSATDYSKKRPHIFTHYFVGANAYVPGQFKDEGKVRMAQDRLKNAAVVALDISKLTEGELGVSVKNIGAGHSIPTGLGDLRQVWLEIKVISPDKKTIFQSGVLDEKGLLPENAIMFRTVFGDDKGAPVINVSKARQILSDTRIKAGETAKRTIKIGKGTKKGSRISVRLLYRSAPQKILTLLPGKSMPPQPVVEMAAADTVI